MTIKAQTEPATTGAGAPPIPVTLRAIAAWLESHPEVEPYEIHLDEARWDTGPASVRVYGLDAERMAELMDTLSGSGWAIREWIGPESQRRLITAVLEIAPHAVLELTRQA